LKRRRGLTMPSERNEKSPLIVRRRPPLDVFFQPRNVAVIGATEEKSRRPQARAVDARRTICAVGAHYLPLNPEFSFREDFIFRSLTRILEFIRIFAETVVDAHLREYLMYSPRALLESTAGLQAVASNVWTLTDELWQGYHHMLQEEPTRRSVVSLFVGAAGTMERHPEIEPRRHPREEKWAAFLDRMSEPDSAMTRLNERYENTLKQTISHRIRHFQQEATRQLPSQTAQAARNANQPSETAERRYPKLDSGSFSEIPIPEGTESRVPSAGHDIPSKPTLADTATRNRRRQIVKRYQETHDMKRTDLARRVAMSPTAIEGMIRGDRSRYSEEKLLKFLEQIGVKPENW
ncbi:MAG TPA: hypothetical protein VN841_23940, partial [Bryobacteraceae bacterium]|nr:hypothetical protein [Bryobacteraceae bacterium]